MEKLLATKKKKNIGNEKHIGLLPNANGKNNLSIIVPAIE